MSTGVLFLQELDELQQEMHVWHQRNNAELQAAHARFTAQLNSLEDLVMGRIPTATSAAASTGFAAAASAVGARNNNMPANLEWDAMLTPSRQATMPGRGGHSLSDAD